MRNITAYAFDDFLLDMDMQNVTYRDHPVRITPKATQILCVLLRDHGRVVDKEHFLKEVWPDTFVEEATLAQNILTLRKAFARFNKAKEFIVTVQRRGYLFVENVEELSGGDAAAAPTRRNGTRIRTREVRRPVEPDLIRFISDVKNGARRPPEVSASGLKKSRSTRSAKMSPDGKRLACSVWDRETAGMLIVLVSAETGEVINYPVAPRSNDVPFLDWSDDGNNLYAVLRRAKAVSLWRISLDGGHPVQLSEWTDELNVRLAFSGEGLKVCYEVQAG